MHLPGRVAKVFFVSLYFPDKSWKIMLQFECINFSIWLQRNPLCTENTPFWIDTCTILHIIFSCNVTLFQQRILNTYSNYREKRERLINVTKKVSHRIEFLDLESMTNLILYWYHDHELKVILFIDVSSLNSIIFFPLRSRHVAKNNKLESCWKTNIHTFNEHDQVLTYLLTLYKKANTVLVLNIAFLSTLHFMT